MFPITISDDVPALPEARDDVESATGKGVIIASIDAPANRPTIAAAVSAISRVSGAFDLVTAEELGDRDDGQLRARRADPTASGRPRPSR